MRGRIKEATQQPNGITRLLDRRVVRGRTRHASWSTATPRSTSRPASGYLVTRTSLRPFADVGPILEPRSIAVIGASDQPGNLGGETVRRLLKFGYPGPRLADQSNGRDGRSACRASPASPNFPRLPTSRSSRSRRTHSLSAIRECADARRAPWHRLCRRPGGSRRRGRRTAARARRLLPRQRLRALRPELRRRDQRDDACDVDILDGAARDRDAATRRHLDGLPERRHRDDAPSRWCSRPASAFAIWSAAATKPWSTSPTTFTRSRRIRARASSAAISRGSATAPKFMRALEEARDRGKPVVLIKAGTTGATARAAQAHTGALGR